MAATEVIARDSKVFIVRDGNEELASEHVDHEQAVKVGKQLAQDVEADFTDDGDES